MNRYLRLFAENQPITQVIEAIRSLILGTPIGNHGWLAVFWSVLGLIVSIPIAARLFARKTTN
jgi:ABC-2 type transport system permease protein